MATIKVELRLKQTVSYHQVVDMEEEDYNTLKNMDDDQIGQLDPEGAIISRYLDPGDIFDSDDYEQVEVFPYKGK